VVHPCGTGIHQQESESQCQSADTRCHNAQIATPQHRVISANLSVEHDSPVGCTPFLITARGAVVHEHGEQHAHENLGGTGVESVIQTRGVGLWPV